MVDNMNEVSFKENIKKYYDDEAGLLPVGHCYQKFRYA